jgi:methyl-accepting chemotaxis protein
MKMAFSTKLILGFVVSSFLTAMIAVLCDYLGYFGLVKDSTTRILFLGLFSLIWGVLSGKVFGLYITRSIKDLMNATSVISKGDLRQKISVLSQDELGSLASTFNMMIESLVGMIEEVKKVADTIYDSAINLSATSQEMNASTQEISSTVQHIAKGAEVQAQMGIQTNSVTKDLAESIDIVASKADEANKFAQEVFNKAQEGSQHTLQAVTRMTDVAQKIDKASRLVQGFRERTLEINNAVRHITSIAQQTHLLALNATIEAARAGEHGRGFAVVAEEVRKLSHETRKLAEQISSLSDTINLESAEVLESMSQSNASAAQSREVVTSASTALQDILNVVQGNVTQVQEITRLTKEQTTSAARLVEAIEEIARIAEDNAAGTQQATAATQEQTAAMQELASSAQELSRTSDRLKSRISAFQY